MTLPSKQELRRIWFTVHKWLGLCLALPVMLVFLSGSILVWRASVDDLLHPKRSVGAAAAQPPAFYFAAARRVLAPGEHVVSLTYPQGRGSVVIMAAGDAGATMQGRMLYYLHPTTGGVLDRASENAGPLRLVHILHGSLFLGRPGGRFVGATAIALLLSAFSGLWLWWPMKAPFIRAMRWRRTQSANANLHHQAGYWLALPLVVLALTGATISFQGSFNAFVGDTAAVQAEIIRAFAPPLPQAHLNLSQVLAAAGTPQPRELRSVTWPTVEDPRWTVRTINGGGTNVVTVDDGSGKVTAGAVRRPEPTGLLMRRIHDGAGMPLVWQIIIFASGLLGATMAVTGAIMWFKGQARGAGMRTRRAAR
jgi:uncharacterized iron-regulated membrane protein